MPDVIPIQNQVLTRKWVFYASTKTADDIFYLIEFIQLCLADMGEDNVIRMLKEDQGRNKTKLNTIGNNWQRFNRNFIRLCKKIDKAKVLYDKIEIKTFAKIETRDELNFLSYMRDFRIIQSDIYGLAIFLMGNSSIRGQTISAQDWKLVENLGFKKMDVSPRRPVVQTEGGNNEQTIRRLDQ